MSSDPVSTSRNSRQINIVLRQNEGGSALPKTGEFRNGRTYPEQGQFADVIKDLDRMIGLDNVKELVFEIYALLQISQYRSVAGLLSSAQVYHMIFKGNPGTGKTTVARIMAKLFHTMGVLSKGHLIEVERADLVGEYIGHTALKTRELVKKAMGGVLFIDEAYSLARGGEKDFGKEAIDALVKSMEDHKNGFVLILAGYSLEMEQFLLTNPGLPSRFAIQVDFMDYTLDQLMQIAELMTREREYMFSPGAEMKLRQHLMTEKAIMFTTFSNARYVRNIIERAVRLQAVRLLEQHPHTIQPSKQDLMLIKPEDIRFEKKSGLF